MSASAPYLKSVAFHLFSAWLPATFVLLCPLIIPAEQVIARAICCLFCTELWLKVIDLGRMFRTPQGQQITFRNCLHFLVPFPTLLVVFSEKRRRRPGNWSALDLIRAVSIIPVFAVGFWLLSSLATVPALQQSFLLDHLVKLVLFVVTIELLSQGMVGAEHLAGYDTTPIIQFGFLSVSVGEFWYRYNSRVHLWLHKNVFVPAGGLRKPVRGVYLTFFVSAVFHELMFDIATSQIDGSQFAFFMLQAPAVFATAALLRIRSRTPWIPRLMSRLATIAWFAISSILFFRGVDRVFQNYYA